MATPVDTKSATLRVEAINFASLQWRDCTFFNDYPISRDDSINPAGIGTLCVCQNHWHPSR